MNSTQVSFYYEEWQDYMTKWMITYESHDSQCTMPTQFLTNSYLLSGTHITCTLWKVRLSSSTNIGLGIQT